MPHTYHADLFDHESQLVVRLKADEWFRLKEFINDELPVMGFDKGMTIVVYTKKEE